MFDWLGGWIECHIFQFHDWTCANQEGIKPTKDQLNKGVDGFWKYACMYCARCGKISKLNKA